MMLRKEALLCSKTGGAGVRVTVAMNDTGSSRNVGYCKGDGENPAYGNISSEELAGVPIWQISSMTKNGS